MPKRPSLPCQCESVFWILGAVLILNAVSPSSHDTLDSALFAAAGLLLLPPVAKVLERRHNSPCIRRSRLFIIGTCLLLLALRASPYRTSDAERANFWSTVCLKNCDDEEASRIATMLYDVRDCGVLKDMLTVIPGGRTPSEWARLVRARARLLECPNF